MNAALHDICTRIARLETERKELAAEVAKIKKQAKEDGYDAGLITKTVAIMLKSGKKQREALQQHELFDTYLNAVGLLRDGEGQPVRAETFPDPFEHLIADVEAIRPAHDPETGELTEPASGDGNHSPEAADGGLDTGPAVPPSTLSPASTETASPVEGADDHSHRSAADDDEPTAPPAGVVVGSFPDMPDFLDRRARA